MVLIMVMIINIAIKGWVKLNYERKIASLEETVLILERRLNEHIGGGGTTAHYRGNELVAGFMYPQDHRRVEQANGKRVDCSNKDLLQLSVGLYVGFNLLNGPFSKVNNPDMFSSVAFVDISQTNDGKKELIVTYSWTGLTFKKIIHHLDGTQSEGSKWLQVESNLVSNKKIVPLSVKVSGEFQYQYIENQFYYDVFAEVKFTGFSGQSSSGIWLENAVPDFLKPINPVHLICVDVLNYDHTLHVSITNGGKLQCMHYPTVVTSDGSFFGSVSYRIPRNTVRKPDEWQV